jgi:chromosome segregation protein
MEGLEQRAQALEAEAAAAAQAHARAATGLERLEAHLIAARAGRDRAHEAVQTARVAAAVAEQRRTAAERLVHSLEAQRSAGASDRVRLHERLTHAAAEHARLRGEVDACAQRYTQAQASVMRAQSQVDQAQLGAGRAASAAAAAAEEGRQVHAGLADAERALARLAAERQHLVARMEALQELALREVGLVLNGQPAADDVAVHDLAAARRDERRLPVAPGAVAPLARAANGGAELGPVATAQGTGGGDGRSHLAAVEAHPEPLEALRGKLERARRQLQALGPVNDLAIHDYEEEDARCRLLREQIDDLQRSAEALREVRAELERTMRTEFQRTLARVAEEFKRYVTLLFRGGSATLALTRPEEPQQGGVEVAVQLPGRRKQDLAALSGGERALVGVALLFAILRARPAPFCVLDEVDAALDEANVGRFCDALEELSAHTQFVVITHNRRTMERAGALYGVSLGADSISQVLSLRLHGAGTGEQAPA